MVELKAPFPYFGGKRRVADVVWRAFGPGVPNYIEPFCGSMATLLARPGGAGKIETVNDRDRYLANFWRAIAADPWAVAAWADGPVNEADLHARHKWLVNQHEFREKMHTDPEFFDAKIAGWWVWGICQWIGTGWCGGIKHGEPRPNLNSGQGVHAAGNVGTRALPHQRPRVSGTAAGQGVLSEKIPNLSGFAGGIRARSLPQQMPYLKGMVEAGVLAGAIGDNGPIGGPGSAPPERGGLPAIGNDRGINGVSAPPCLEWFRALQSRLRRVRVVCGDWTRVLGPSVLGKGKNVGGRRPCGVILDPPYDVNMRAKRIYNHDAPGLAAAVREWALEHGDDPDLRIVLCGYFEEHAAHMPPSWRVHRWKGARGYAAEENDNREQETIWFSPHCLRPDVAQGSLFT